MRNRIECSVGITAARNEKIGTRAVTDQPAQFRASQGLRPQRRLHATAVGPAEENTTILAHFVPLVFRQLRLKMRTVI